MLKKTLVAPFQRRIRALISLTKTNSTLLQVDLALDLGFPDSIFRLAADPGSFDPEARGEAVGGVVATRIRVYTLGLKVLDVA